VQDNFSISKKNVLRGIHYQITQPQGKAGAGYARSGAGCGCGPAPQLAGIQAHVAVELSGENGKMLWIPAGFGHAFLVLSEVAGFAYKVTDYYAPAGERTIVWNDPELAIAWPVKAADVIVSAKDAEGKLLREADLFE
jgi:dTDP-4-dehydrorhamnose 3,5-epimerase